MASRADRASLVIALSALTLTLALSGCSGSADLTGPPNGTRPSRLMAATTTEGCPQDQRPASSAEWDTASTAMGFDPQDCPVNYYIVETDLHSTTLTNIPLDGRFNNTGACTAGWEIWVDNKKVCNQDGTKNMS